MIDMDQMTEGTVVAWVGTNGWVRGVVESTSEGYPVVTMQNGRQMNVDAVAGSPSSKILGRFTRSRKESN